MTNPASSANFQIYGDTAKRVAGEYNVPWPIFGALIEQESRWNQSAVGADGEIGLTQLMPGTASDMGVNPWNAEDNMRGAAKYLSAQFEKFGNWSDALAAYNKGPGGYQKESARKYASEVMARTGNYGDVSQVANVASSGASSSPSSVRDAFSGVNSFSQVFTGEFWKKAGVYILAGVVIVILIGGGSYTIIRPITGVKS